MTNSRLDQQQIIQRVFDEAAGKLKVDAEVTATIGVVTVDISAANGDNIAISDGTHTMSVNADGTINANVTVNAADGDSIKISDGVHSVVVNTDGSLNVVDITDNTRQKILKSSDRIDAITWLDFGLSTQRISKIEYSSVIYGATSRKSFSYTLSGGAYQLDSITWSIV